MFRISVDRLRAWMKWTEDVLGDPVDEQLLAHPHRRPLRWERKRRPGMVPAPPAHCISPLRHGSPGTRRDRVRG
jgi:hypothetical protein